MIHVLASYGISLTILAALFIISFCQYLETTKCTVK
ncbi:putative membrane protein [Orientia chuto str. Dubai]|uniref:Putative membrane protein n=1 Tax=Orientia chuto str. Dubai TaxID=1359168 RepID=A0A0F3MPX8_9RICK|nr:putative membrane protein [Orientia chuto str. Dubai]